jgi:hypothetical protein
VDKPAARRRILLTFRAQGTTRRVVIATTTSDGKGRFAFHSVFRRRGA